MKTWQEKAREYIKWKNNPLSNSNSEVAKYRNDLQFVNIFNLSEEDKELLSQTFN